jgi:hypothetical protein
MNVPFVIKNDLLISKFETVTAFEQCVIIYEIVNKSLLDSSTANEKQTD